VLVVRAQRCMIAKDAFELPRKNGYRAVHLTDGVAEWRAHRLPVEEQEQRLLQPRSDACLGAAENRLAGNEAAQLVNANEQLVLATLRNRRRGDEARRGPIEESGRAKMNSLPHSPTNSVILSPWSA
jgi:hypothetical protein